MPTTGSSVPTFWDTAPSLRHCIQAMNASTARIEMTMKAILSTSPMVAVTLPGAPAFASLDPLCARSAWRMGPLRAPREEATVGKFARRGRGWWLPQARLGPSPTCFAYILRRCGEGADWPIRSSDREFTLGESGQP